MGKIGFIFFSILVFFSGGLFAQVKTPQANLSGVYAGSDGILRWKNNRQEAAFFGVNYTVPFAYGYRSHRRLGLDHEQAIDRDVYHLARLGVNAFRVHVWDTEISDSLGNLKNNEHLRLFDYLLSKLEERGIYILITPIAFWGNGYPDPDEKTGSFSEKYGKERALREENAFLAQERYLKQFFSHVNPYTKKRYSDDAWVIATEINNEPHHSGLQERVTGYINRMLAAIKSTGWTKPVFYNISESPAYASAVAASKVNGFSFQWYPTGLVAGHELKGNYLPNVDRYAIPFDTIAAFNGKPRMVYEFDAADVMQPVMYPFMARSFRTAGFSWATQFAYDPLGTAYANTEYQTHYLNLAYTPAKALSLLIAGEVFRGIPAGTSFGAYPADSVFGAFKVSYSRGLSEMNTAGKFYYSNSTDDRPVNAALLQHIAGVGSSPVVSYTGSGAYFLDKLADGVWRLEVMPDVLQLKDPFERTSLEREVRRTIYREQVFGLTCPDLGQSFSVKGLNKGNTLNATAVSGRFSVKPGTYLLVRKGRTPWKAAAGSRTGYLGLAEFFAPPETAGLADTIPHMQDNAGDESDGNSGGLLYNPAKDVARSAVYPGIWGKNKYEYVKDASGKSFLKLEHEQQEHGLAAIEVYVKDRIGSVASADTLIIEVSATAPIPLRAILCDATGTAFSASAEAAPGPNVLKLPLTQFTRDSMLLMPRPYPGFQPLYFMSGKEGRPDLNHIEKLQLSYPVKGEKALSLTIGTVSLKQSDH